MTIEQIRRATMHDTTPRMNTLVIRRLQHQLFDRAKSWEDHKESFHLPQSTRKTLMALFERLVKAQPDILLAKREGTAAPCHLTQCYWVELVEARPTHDSFLHRKQFTDRPVRLWDFHLFVYLRFVDEGKSRSWNLCLQVPLYMIDEHFTKAWRNTVAGKYRTRVFGPEDSPLIDMAYVMSYRPALHDFSFLLKADPLDVCTPQGLISDWKGAQLMSVSFQHECLLADVMERAIKDNGRRKNYARR